jgi:uncharacterized protein YqhQ
VSARTFFRLLTQIQLLPALESGEETLVGGQAVMEGVMMRAPHSYCVAVRRPDGTVVTEEMPLARMSELYPIFKYPVLRGLGTLYQAMKLGIKALRFSANAALADAAAASGEKTPTEIPGWAMALNLIFSLAFFLFMYKFLPLYLATRLESVFPALQGRLTFNFADGIIRMIIFLGFLWTISRFRDIRRLFEYHGAEHKVVFNYESGQPVTVDNAQRFTTFHPRCGTSFLMLLMIVSLLIYPFIPFDGFAARFFSRIALLPLIIGVSYELIRFAARRPGSFLAALTAPGLWLQRITTRPPSDEQAAVAIHALEGAMALEEAQGGELVIS